MSKTIALVFPNQLFENNPLFDESIDEFVLIEEHLFFNQYPFHKQKLAYHRVTMKTYARFLESKDHATSYIDSTDENSDIRTYLKNISEGVSKLVWIDPCDFYLSQHLHGGVDSANLEYQVLSSPMFLTSKEDLADFFEQDKKRYFHHDFYQIQRKRFGVLMDDGEPEGGKWSFDDENRKKYPKKKTPPTIEHPDPDDLSKKAVDYVNEHFSDNPGELNGFPLFPSDFESAQEWLTTFLNERFEEFGDYEDAIVKDEIYLNHSVITPMLNTGLITPEHVLDEVIKRYREQDTPINSVEGYVRQIIGWREFMRGLYEFKGVQERTTNYWEFDREIPPSFYDGTTGIEPLDDTIKKVLQTGYCHHIERLMILGNFMLLCEFHPDSVYRWFMELFIDSYDWVMVPNVYGMSQFADGGIMATKPYISGSNYIKKMSDYGKGDWQKTWDGLFWRFMDKHRDFFKKNPRMNMLVSTFDKMSSEKREGHLTAAEKFLEKLDQ